MDRVPCDGHSSYRCRSRSRKPATAHPHRGGWYVFAKTKPQLQIQSTPLNLPLPILTTTTPSSSLPPLPASNKTVATWFFQPYFGLCTFFFFFLLKTLWLTLQKHLLGFFPPTLLNFNTWYGILSWRPPTSSPNCHFWNFEIFSAVFFFFEWQHFFT